MTDEPSLFLSDDEGFGVEAALDAQTQLPPSESAPSGDASTRSMRPVGAINEIDGADGALDAQSNGHKVKDTAQAGSSKRLGKRKSEKQLLAIDNPKKAKVKRKRRQTGDKSDENSDDFVTRTRKSKTRKELSASESDAESEGIRATSFKHTVDTNKRRANPPRAIMSESESEAEEVHRLLKYQRGQREYSAQSSHSDQRSRLSSPHKAALPSFRTQRDFRPDHAQSQSTPNIKNIIGKPMQQGSQSARKDNTQRHQNGPQSQQNTAQTQTQGLSYSLQARARDKGYIDSQVNHFREQERQRKEAFENERRSAVDLMRQNRHETQDASASRTHANTLAMKHIPSDSSRDNSASGRMVSTQNEHTHLVHTAPPGSGVTKNVYAHKQVIDLSSDSENETGKEHPSEQQIHQNQKQFKLLKDDDDTKSFSSPVSTPYGRSSTGHKKKSRKFSSTESTPAPALRDTTRPLNDDDATYTNTLHNGRTSTIDTQKLAAADMPLTRRANALAQNSTNPLQTTPKDHSFYEYSSDTLPRLQGKLARLEREARVDNTQVIEAPGRRPAKVKQVIKPVFLNMPREQQKEYDTCQDKPYSEEAVEKISELESWKLGERPDEFVGLKFIGSVRRHPRSGEVLNSKSLEHTFLAHIEQAETLMDNRNTFSIRNDVDDEPCPPIEFIYSNKPSYGSGVPKNNEKALRRCGCNGKCDPTTCECFQRQRYIFEGFVDRHCAYDDDGLLNTRDLPIFECNEFCGCDDSCPNKVTSKPTKFNLEIFKKKRMGWGVRTRRRIKKGQFIAVYSGEYITNDMAIHRSDVYDKVNRKYDFDIDFYHLRNKKMYAKATQCNSKGFEKLDEDDADNVGNTSTGTANETGLPLQSLISPQKELQQHRDIDFDLQSYYTIDAFFTGNFTRFINHCCKPNLIVQPVYTIQTSVDLPFLGFYALRDIKNGEELSISYMGVDSDEEDVEQALRRKKRKKKRDGVDEDETMEDVVGAICYCGAPNCRGKLFNTQDNVIEQ